MGTRLGERYRIKDYSIKVLRSNNDGQIAQVLHPYWLDRNDVYQMGTILNEVESLISKKAPQVELVLTGGGFIEFHFENEEPNRYWRTDSALKSLIENIEGRTDVLSNLLLQNCDRDYIIGVDNKLVDRGVGQFALVFARGESKKVIWKGFPVEEESKWLAGFGTEYARHCPRIVKTSLGQALVLVCHDIQAFNHRNRTNVNRAAIITDRGRVIEEMDAQMNDKKPSWVFNLIHCIGKEGSIDTFQTSCEQIFYDHKWKPSVVGSFGFEQPVINALNRLSEAVEMPIENVGCTLAIIP